MNPTTKIFDPQSMVDLPPMDVEAGLDLALHLIEASRLVPEQPRRIVRARELVTLRRSELEDVDPSEQPRLLRAAEDASRRAVQAWAALESWLIGWERLPVALEEGIAARRILGMVFPEGLLFLRLPTRQRYAEAARRMALIEQYEMAHDFVALGGGRFLVALRDTHRSYGDALRALPSEEPQSDAGRRFDLLKASIRAYVMQIVASIDDEDASSVEGARLLLLPLSRFRAGLPAAEPRAA